MSWKLRTLVSLSCAVMAGQALAAELDTRVYIVPSVNYTVMDNDWRAEDDFGFGLGVGKPITEHLNLELNGTYGEYNRNSGLTGNVKNTGLMFDALYIFNRDAGFSPYLVAGAGGVQSRATGLSETNWAANAGVGVMSWMHDIALRGDVRYRYLDSVGSVHHMGDWIATVGLMIPLGAKPVPPAPAPAPAPEPTPAPVAAPEPAPEPAPAIERPAPQTKIIFEGTNFDFDKATLRPAGKAKLDENVKTLMAYPDINVDIVGYTDSIGTAKYNQGLSNRRAATVKKYMESKGVAASRMNTKGMGEKDPIASNKTAAGRAENRRVEIVILN
ncbi:MAG: OmpA family protein [Pseudomonadota bacterium]